MNTSSPTSPKKPDPLKILIQGAPGSWKTTLALQFPDPHIFYCDSSLDGPESFLRNPKQMEKWGIPGITYTSDNIRYDESKKPRPLEKCFDHLVSLIKKAQTDPSYLPRKTIITDNLSHIANFLAAKTLAAQGKDFTSVGMEIRDWGTFKIAAYGLIVPWLESLGKNIIVLCHENRITAPDSNPFQKVLKGYEPSFPGQVGNDLASFFGDYWRLEVGKGAAGGVTWKLQPFRTALCSDLKNSFGLTEELDLNPTDPKQPRGFKVLEPYLKGKI